MASRRVAQTKPGTAEDISTRPTLPAPVPSGRYRWAMSQNEKETVPPSPKRKHGLNEKFEVASTVRRPLKIRERQ